MIAESLVQFDHVLALAYRLSPLEKIKLVKHMADALEQEPVLATHVSLTVPILATPASELTWGAQVVELLHTLDTSEWQAIDMPDVVEWVKEQRAQQDRQRNIWRTEE